MHNIANLLASCQERRYCKRMGPCKYDDRSGDYIDSVLGVYCCCQHLHHRHATLNSFKITNNRFSPVCVQLESSTEFGRPLRFKEKFSPRHRISTSSLVLFDSGMLYLIVTIPHFIVWWTPNSSVGILVLGWIVRAYIEISTPSTMLTLETDTA